MTEKELLDFIDGTIMGLHEHFVVEDCENEYVEGCMSCEALMIVQLLEGMKEWLDD